MRIIPKSAISRLKFEQWAMCTRWSTVWLLFHKTDLMFILDGL